MPACEYEPPPYKGPDYNHIRQVRGSLLNPALLTNFSSPLLIYDGYMQWLFDHTGKRYLDLFGGIVTISIGHCHPKVVAAATEQINRLWHTTNIYLHPKVHEYAERLTQTLPGDLKVVYFVNSGSDANDLAMMMARLYTKNFDLVSLRNSYHGASPYTSGLTASNTWKYNFANGFGIHHGVGGTVQFPLGYLKKAFELVRSNGGVCISDEVQTGFGRTGEHFWGFEGHDVIPDIVTMAKGIGNGFPLAAVVTTPDIAKTMTGALHFNTFGGNPISSAVGLSVLEVIEEEKIQQNSLEVGTYFLQKLAKLREDYTIVGDVRGKGLMIGIEMVQDKTNQTPLNPQTMMDIWDACRDLGVILGRGGLYGTVFRIKPPMCITHADVDFTIAVLQHVLDETTKTL
ncbi:Alanine--glyoxylate aminotransferase 2 1-like [Homarus americanus]|uniref:Alanine--glyoxylate aminotransferase 2, mitochondrial n=1 Tax=Homarus americanus TaxID=6706 RepID=A0A8J5MTU5_HOMAM|nr:Alanine--glyoxylate aminotransferase 2 1-like [Homarus americanus]